MIIIEKEKLDSGQAGLREPKVPGGAVSKNTTKPTQEEPQIADLVRTFTDRWEW